MAIENQNQGQGNQGKTPQPPLPVAQPVAQPAPTFALTQQDLSAIVAAAVRAALAPSPEEQECQYPI